MKRAILIQPDGTYEITEIDGRYETLRDAVGGWIEALDTGVASIYINEEGKLLELPPNPLATDLWRLLLAPMKVRDYICGPAVVLGPVDGNGDDTEVSVDTIQAFATVLAASRQAQR